MKNISIAQPLVGRQEIRAVVKVLKSGALAQGKKVGQFEEAFAMAVSAEHCVAVNSGTSALHLALLSLGIGAGDEVIVPSFTFAATANSVALTGARPVFVDVNPQTYNIDPDKIEQAISAKTKAIQVVHLYGLPANMSEIVRISKKHNLKIVEDAAQAHLASIDGKFVGTFGDAAAFSFYPTKNMTSGEGGMIIFRKAEHARTARLLRNQGMEVRYQNELIGFNLRMTDIHAAIGIEQLKKLSKWTEKREDNASFLNQSLSGVVVPHIPPGYRHVFHQYTIRLDGNRDEFSRELTNLGIGNSVYYPIPVHRLPAFESTSILPHTDQASRQVLSLPVHPSLSKRELKRIAQAVSKIADKHGA